jgi:hypothetical protein
MLLYGIAALALFVFFRVAIAAWQGSVAIRRFRRRYGPEGKDLLLVYSNNPPWQEYVESRWLPRWSTRAVVVNWSDRGRWSGAEPEVALFRAIAGGRERHPIAIVVPPEGPVRVIRFWRAFREWRQGKELALRTKESELESVLAAPGQERP